MIDVSTIIPGLLAALALVTLEADQPAGLDQDSCKYDGFALYGDIQVVESFPDLKVQVVESFADLHVQFVDSFPDSCGKWRIVDSFPDLKIQYVESFPDIKIKKVTSFPGMQ